MAHKIMWLQVLLSVMLALVPIQSQGTAPVALQDAYDPDELSYGLCWFGLNGAYRSSFSARSMLTSTLRGRLSSSSTAGSLSCHTVCPTSTSTAPTPLLPGLSMAGMSASSCGISSRMRRKASSRGGVGSLAPHRRGSSMPRPRYGRQTGQRGCAGAIGMICLPSVMATALHQQGRPAQESCSIRHMQQR